MTGEQRSRGAGEQGSRGAVERRGRGTGGKGTDKKFATAHYAVGSGEGLNEF